MSRKTESIVVLGCGTIGLPLAVAFALRGLDVLGVDSNPERVASLTARDLPAAEPGLMDALRQAAAQGQLRFSTGCDRTSEPRALILAVPTPVDAAGTVLADNLQAAFEAAVACGQDQDLLVIRSTVPVGTTRRLAQEIASQGRAMMVAACPDRSISGQTFDEQFSVPHVVGGIDRASAQAALALFEQLGKTVEVSSPEAAETVKLFCNVQRDVTFALANHFVLISEALGLDIAEIERAATIEYPRFRLSRPGPVGGPCLPKDPLLLDHSLDGRRNSPGLSRVARDVNVSLLDHVMSGIADHLAESGNPAPVISVLGLAFKGDPPTSDTRGSFGVAIAQRLKIQSPKALIRTWEPEAKHDDPIEAAFTDADVAVLANDHPSIRGLDLKRAAELMRPHGLIYDVCGGFDRAREALPNDVRLRIFGRSPLFDRAEDSRHKPRYRAAVAAMSRSLAA